MVVFAAPSFRKYILFLQPKPNMTYFPYLFVVFLKERRRDVAYRYLFRRKKSIVNCWTPRPRATGGGGAHSSNRQVFGYAGLLRVIKCSLQCLLHSAPRREIIRYKPGRESLANLTNNFLFVLFFRAGETGDPLSTRRPFASAAAAATFIQFIRNLAERLSWR